MSSPAIEYSNGDKEWYINNKLHREDGPAIECSNGTRHYFFKGKQIIVSSNKEYLSLMKMKGFW